MIKIGEKIMIEKKCRSLIFLIGMVTLPSCAFADAGVPMIALMYPAFLWALVPIIFLETEIYRRRINLPYKKLLVAVAAGNAFSSLLGYPLSWAFMLSLELLTTWGPSLDGVWRKVVAVTLQAAWLSPSYEKDLYWILPISALVGLIPAYFISVYSEEMIIRLILKQRRSEILPISWSANLWSYGLIVLICMALVASLFSKTRG